MKPLILSPRLFYFFRLPQRHNDLLKVIYFSNTFSKLVLLPSQTWLMPSISLGYCICLICTIKFLLTVSLQLLVLNASIWFLSYSPAIVLKTLIYDLKTKYRLLKPTSSINNLRFESISVLITLMKFLRMYRNRILNCMRKLVQC